MRKYVIINGTDLYLKEFKNYSKALEWVQNHLLSDVDLETMIREYKKNYVSFELITDLIV